MTRVVGCLALVASAAMAQVPSSDLEQVWLDAPGRGSLWVGNGQTLKAGQFRAGAGLTYGYAPMRSTALDTPQPLVSDRFGLQVFGALGLFDWLELSTVVPAIFAQRGSEAVPVSPAGLGTPWLHVRVPIWTDPGKPLLLSAGLGVGVPVGTGGALGNGGLAFLPRITAGHVFRELQFGVELSGLFRPAVDYSGLTGQRLDVIGSQVALAGMVSSVATSGPRGEASLRVFVPLSGGRPGVESLFGVRWPLGDVELFGGAGPALFGEPSTPQLRVLLGAAFANVPMTRPACVEGLPYELAECPDLDRDGDRVPNVADLAPLEPEDVDGFQDTDGRPDPDNDADEVPDATDRCPNERGPQENGGCPDRDGDDDGVLDRLDGCPEQSGPRENGGCPDTDVDVDGVIDRLDGCPGVTGALENRGCPWPDSDADGVVDREDNCPQASGPRLNAGCPVEQRQLVVLTPERLLLREKVLFDTGKATIQKRSVALLDNLAAVLVGHPELSVRIEAHTDSAGKPELNLALSQARADAVKAALGSRGVDGARLVAQGFGGERPDDTNDTAAGRENNRRVEFFILPPP
ncbi:MAG: OmpA family protein [Myxococcaceae bacterium]|nr:OmpA family protein [Myxococcaceae bacterium]